MKAIDATRANDKASPKGGASKRQEDFPIPFPYLDARSDLGTARLLLSAVDDVMADCRDLSSARVETLLAVLREVSTRLDVIQLFLDDLECPNEDEQFQAARRFWTLQHAGKAVAP